MLSLFFHPPLGEVQLCPRRHRPFPITLFVRHCRLFISLAIFLHDRDTALFPVYILTSPINPPWGIQVFWKIYRRIESSRLKSLTYVRRVVTLDEVTYHQTPLALLKDSCGAA
jgi:hypothetical protein